MSTRVSIMDTHKIHRAWIAVAVIAALMALVASVAGVAFLEMAHPLTAAILNIR
jgi:hypothetical protein